MSETTAPVGQSDVVRLFTIPHCVSTIEETVALIRSNRDAWLQAQAAPKG